MSYKTALRPFDVVINFPTAIITVVFTVLTLGILVLLSVKLHDNSFMGQGYSLENYISIITDPTYSIIMLRSLFISGMVTLATIVLAYPVAYYISFVRPEARNQLLLLVTLPFWISYLLRVFAWKIILGYNGILNSWLVDMHFIDEPLAFLLYTPTAVVITLAHAYAAFAILPIYVCLSAINKNLVEAARDLGANKLQVFSFVILPLSMPGVVAATAVVFIPTLGDYVTPTMVGGPNSTMVGNLIQAQFGSANNWQLGAALALVTIFMVILLFALKQLSSHLYRRWFV